MSGPAENDKRVTPDLTLGGFGHVVPPARAEVLAAGFKLEQEAAFLRNPEDPREQAFFDMKIPADRFALRFVKPR